MVTSENILHLNLTKKTYHTLFLQKEDRMFGQAILAGVLVTLVSAQRGSEQTPVQAGSQVGEGESFWSTLPDSSRGQFDFDSTSFGNMDGSSFYENQDSMADQGSAFNSPYDYDLARRMFDNNMQGRGMGRFLSGDMRQSSLGRSLGGLTSDGASSVLDGSRLDDNLSGFGRRMNFRQLPQGRTRMGLPFQTNDLQSMYDGFRGMGRRMGRPFRSLGSDSQTGLTSQLGSDLGMMGRSLGRRFDMRRGQMGEMNLMEDLQGDRLRMRGMGLGRSLGSSLRGDSDLRMLGRSLGSSGRSLGSSMRYDPFRGMSMNRGMLQGPRRTTGMGGNPMRPSSSLLSSSLGSRSLASSLLSSSSLRGSPMGGSQPDRTMMSGSQAGGRTMMSGTGTSTQVGRGGGRRSSF